MLDDAHPDSAVRIAQDAASFKWDDEMPQRGIGIALSGGGFRAMLFHAGALARMNELGLLSQAKRISSVSGGSIIAGQLALSWSALSGANADGVFANFQSIVVDPIYSFSRQKIDVVDALTGALPWETASGEVAKSYEKYLFGAKTLQDLPDSPMFIFCATNLQTGVLWRFSKPYAGDYVIGRLDRPATPVSHAVSASSAFPPIFSPFLLQPPAGSFANWPEGPILAPGEIAGFCSRVMLCDGGVYDNHGVEPIVKGQLTNFVSDGGAPFARMSSIQTDWISQLRRILDVTDNQVRALRRRDLIARFIAGNKAKDETQLTGDARMGAYWGIDTDPRKLNPPNALPCDPDLAHQLARVGTRLSDLGETISKQIVNWGYVICDRSLRANYTGPMSPSPAAPKPPYPDAPLTGS
ncbi:patatin-like phospholipase family protein [Bradyrhizobium sp.]|uniref:patatin-like phospholipase family protein n=1 Tax=Bradyrhizobium sp. TaxID=376 RepID=UPI003C598C45